MKPYKLIILSENKPGVLYRVADLFLRRKINIDSLHVTETEKKGISRFVIKVTLDEEAVATLIKQLHRIIEVREVYEDK